MSPTRTVPQRAASNGAATVNAPVRRLNLTRARAARWEAMGARPVIEVGDVSFELPNEVNLLALEFFQGGQFDAGCRVLFGEEAWQAIKGDGFYQGDLELVMKDLYDLDLGEFRASSASSTSAGAS